MPNRDEASKSSIHDWFFGADGLFAEQNRGRLLDLTVFAANVFLMWLVTPLFLRTLEMAGAEDPLAIAVVLLLLVAVFILPPVAAILKRHSYHRRKGGPKLDIDKDGAFGCLLNPIPYFCLQIVIACTLNALFIHYVLGVTDPGPELFLGSLFTLLILTILHTVFVYRYFSPPKKEPRSDFLLSHNAELLGDVFIFINMLIFQLVWNLLTTAEMFSRVTGIEEFLGRLLLLTFLALLIYFPPRIFYLAEDARRPSTWLTILLANSPVIFNVVIGGNSS